MARIPFGEGCAVWGFNNYVANRHWQLRIDGFQVWRARDGRLLYCSYRDSKGIEFSGSLEDLFDLVIYPTPFRKWAVYEG